MMTNLLAAVSHDHKKDYNSLIPFHFFFVYFTISYPILLYKYIHVFHSDAKKLPNSFKLVKYTKVFDQLNLLKWFIVLSFNE